MRVMVMVMGQADYEGGAMPTQAELAEMGRFNEELVKAGVMLAGDGLQPSSKSKRVEFKGKERTVVDGPFAEAKELVAGYWILQCKSWDECVEWVKRAPMAPGDELEIRQFFELEDFALTPEQDAQFRSTEAKLKDRAQT